MSKNRIARILAAFTAFGLTLPLLPVSALTGPLLIKGPGDAVYYLSSDGRRYVFPNANAYKTWYADFSQVQTVSIGELASYPIGGNVTYRPGFKLVKITTDPRVYAVGSGGFLRWIKTEAVAQALYGTDWNKKIDDVPDAFFVNYVMGPDIVNASDYPPASILAATVSIDADLAVRRQVNPQPLPPVSQPPISSTSTSSGTATSTTSTFAFTVSKSHIQGGDTVLLTGSSNVPAGIQKMELFADGQLVKLCNIQSCTGEFTVPLSGTKGQYDFEGRLTKLDASVESKLLTLTVQTNGSDAVKATVGQAVITSGQLASVAVDIVPGIAIIRVDINVGNGVIKACADGARQCKWADYLQGPVGTVFPVFAKVTDSLGRTYTSKSSSITIGTNDSPSVTLLSGKNSMYTGETVDLTANAGDNDGIASIEILQDGAVIKHCDSPAACTVLAGPFSAVGTHEFTARAYDTKNMAGTTQDGVTVEVRNNP